MNRPPLRSPLLSAMIVATSVLPTGCRQEDDEPQVVTLEGTIEAIEQTGDDSGKVSVLYFNEKQKQEMLGVGQVTPETEIMINGVAAALSDLREGDKVRGTVRVDRTNGQRTQTALTVHVDRPQPVGEQPPTAQPGTEEPPADEDG